MNKERKEERANKSKTGKTHKTYRTTEIHQDRKTYRPTARTIHEQKKGLYTHEIHTNQVIHNT